MPGFDGSALSVPPLETARLLIRPFALDDLDAAHRVLDREIDVDAPLRKTERERWLRWTVLGYEQLARLYQPPYGDRAIVLKATGELIGSCGYAPILVALPQIPGLPHTNPARPGCNAVDIGLYWAIAPSHRRQGYATEAGAALIDYAFNRLDLTHILATTEYDNRASQAVMRRLGMRLERNPLETPPWLQVVGVLENPMLGATS